MGEDFGAWRPQPNFRPPPNLNPSGPAKPVLGQFVYMKPSTNMAFANGFSPSFGIPEAANLPMGQASEPHGWFYCLSRFRQAFAPCPRSDLEEKLRRETAAKPGPETKKFLVVDRSGDQTTLIFSSGTADPVRCLGAWKRSPEEYAGGSGAEKRASKKRLSEPISSTDETGAESEMREDTEELDALLYSDDEDSDSSEDDEVTSTGHSPSTMTSSSSSSSSDDKQEEVASSAGSSKKRKLSAEPKPDPKPKSWFESEDDAESSCGNEESFGSREIDFAPSSNKRIKREKIRETVGILQTIIPDGQGKDAIVVLDEAIQYLKSLKVKAKALGLDAI